QRFQGREHRLLRKPRRADDLANHELLLTTFALGGFVQGVARVGGLPEVGPGGERLGVRGGHEFAAHADSARGGDFFGAFVVGVDLVGHGPRRGGRVDAADGGGVGDRGAFFDGDRGAGFAFAGERGGGRGGLGFWRFGAHRLDLRAALALGGFVAWVARVGGLPEVGPGCERLGVRGGHEFAAHADSARGGDFCFAFVVGVDLVGHGPRRGGRVGAADGGGVGDRGAFFDGDRGAGFAFAGERGGGRGGLGFWRFGAHRLDVRVAVAVGCFVAWVARVGGLPEVGPGCERLGVRGGHEFAAHAD